ncbi:hypothetical protein IEQ34_021942 [Dendrobium chrysotoxum]|uniref:Uncharacterized protein n=1 Tax=Dendrobium chrysotoxum TaxID=161865 RepID=A0AAV7FXI3_DENCH|nr:hypothetical protein IEQ34_021942 [Dendrobium chrysotoxum]
MAGVNVPPSFYSNNSFHVLYNTHLHLEPSTNVKGEEEEAVREPAVSAPLHLESSLDHLLHMFHQWEACLDSYVITQEQQHAEDVNRFNAYITQQCLTFQVHKINNNSNQLKIKICVVLVSNIGGAVLVDFGGLPLYKLCSDEIKTLKSTDFCEKSCVITSGSLLSAKKRTHYFS